MEHHLNDIWMDVQGCELLTANAHQQIQRLEDEVVVLFINKVTLMDWCPDPVSGDVRIHEHAFDYPSPSAPSTNRLEQPPPIAKPRESFDFRAFCQLPTSSSVPLAMFSR